MIRTCAACGERFELAGLRWPAVDLAGGAVNIRLSKMGKGRSVKLHPDLATHLMIWRSIQAGGDGWPVFSLDGDPIVPNRIGKICARIREQTGLPLTGARAAPFVRNMGTPRVRRRVQCL